MHPSEMFKELKIVQNYMYEEQFENETKTLLYTCILLRPFSKKQTLRPKKTSETANSDINITFPYTVTKIFLQFSNNAMCSATKLDQEAHAAYP